MQTELIFIVIISIFWIVTIFILDDPSDKTSMRCLASLENIDDDLDSHGIPAVKMSDVQAKMSKTVSKSVIGQLPPILLCLWLVFSSFMK